MKLLLFMICAFLLNACANYLGTSYQGTYYSPKSNYGNVILIGSCGDETPSGLDISTAGVKIEITADDLIITEPITSVWISATSKTPFTITSLPKVTKFIGKNQNVEPISMHYRYTDSDYKNIAFDSANEIPDKTGPTTNLRVQYDFNYLEKFTLIISEMNVSGQNIENIKVEFENNKIQRNFSLSKC